MRQTADLRGPSCRSTVRLPRAGTDAAGSALWGRVAVVVEVTDGGLRALPAALTLAGCAVRTATDVADARRSLALLGPEAVVIVEARQPPAVIVASLPALSRQAAVVVCTPRASSQQRIALLTAGADAVVTGGDAQEVVAVLTAVVRRARAAVPVPRPELLSVGDLHVHLSARVATAGGRTLRLTSLEFDLLAYFASRPGDSLSRQQLLSDVWGYDVGGLDTVTVHVRRLRTKIEQDPSRPQRLQTVWGVGYRLCAEHDVGLLPAVAATAV